MDLDPKCIFVQRERNLDVHHPVIKLVASLARNRGVTFTEIHTKQQLQTLLFPSGMSYDKKNDKVRTSEINLVFLYMAYFQQLITKKKRGIPELSLDYASFADSVAGSRIELPTSGL